MSQAFGTNGQKIFRVKMKKSKLPKSTSKYRKFYKSESIFVEWLGKNIHRFNNKPISNGKGGFYFDGITQAISLLIDFSTPEAILSFDDLKTQQNYDYHTIQYIGDLKFNPLKGFYDADRTDKVYTYYNSYKELIIAEVFEPIIEYCNENFKEDNSLYLLIYGGTTKCSTDVYSSEGFIASSNESKKTTKLSKIINKSNKNFNYLKYKLFT